jgi:hypothetical protein
MLDGGPAFLIQLEFDFVGEEPDVMLAFESTHLHTLRFDNIAAMIANRNQPIWLTSRKICGEMAAIIKRLQKPVEHYQRRVSQTCLNNRMKALRALQRTLLENEALSKSDVLDLDGGKFKFVFGEILRLFRQALGDAGMDDLQAQSVILCVDDLLRASDATLRWGISQIETAPMRRPAHEEALLA